MPRKLSLAGTILGVCTLSLPAIGRDADFSLQTGQDLQQVSRPQSYHQSHVNDNQSMSTERLSRARMIAPPAAFDTRPERVPRARMISRPDQEIGGAERLASPHKLLSSSQEQIDRPMAIQRPTPIRSSDVTSSITSTRQYDSGMHNRQTSLMETRTSDLDQMRRDAHTAAPSYTTDPPSDASYGGFAKNAHNDGQHFGKMIGSASSANLAYTTPNPALSSLTGVSRLKAATQRGDLPRHPSFTQEDAPKSDFRVATPDRTVKTALPSNILDPNTPGASSQDFNAARLGNKLTTLTAPVYPIQ